MCTKASKACIKIFSFDLAEPSCCPVSPPSTKVKNELSNTSTRPTCFHGTDRNSFTFLAFWMDTVRKTTNIIISASPWLTLKHLL
jgi:hypothetical protein